MDLRLFVILFNLLVVIHNGLPQRTSGLTGNTEKEPFDIVVILPQDNKHKFSLSHVLPGIEIAVESDKVKNILPNDMLDVKWYDGACDLKKSPLIAIDCMINKSVDIFFGPVCTYAAAPIARYAKHWRRAMVTAGGSAEPFFDKEEYHLTRTFLIYQKTGEALSHIMTDHFKWLNSIFVYRADSNDLSEKDCFFLTNAFHKAYSAINPGQIEMEWFYESNMGSATAYRNDLIKYIKYATRGM